MLWSIRRDQTIQQNGAVIQRDTCQSSGSEVIDPDDEHVAEIIQGNPMVAKDTSSNIVRIFTSSTFTGIHYNEHVWTLCFVSCKMPRQWRHIISQCQISTLYRHWNQTVRTGFSDLCLLINLPVDFSWIGHKKLQLILQKNTSVFWGVILIIFSQL